MRCFIAVDIDERIIKAIADLQNRIRKDTHLKKGDVKWVRPEAMHLTLKFLGEVADERIVEVCNMVRDAAAEQRSFELDIEKVGCFGGKNARVLWVGAGDGASKLCRLQESIEYRLKKAGWPAEARKFTGHLTLCRIRSAAAGAKLAAMVEDYKDFKPGSTMVESVCVYESQLRPEGPVYTVLGNYKLQ